MVHPIVFLPLFIAILIVISGFTATKGSIVILENPNGQEITMDFKEWSANEKCELSLNKGERVQVEVVCEAGAIALEISGKNGSKPYEGNNLQSSVFTVTVSETDKYDIYLTGKKATGKIKVQK